MDDGAAELVASFKTIATRRALRRAIVGYFKREGISKLSYHGHFSDGAPREPATEGYPEAWVKRYIDQDLELIDPFRRIASQRVHPFRWSEAQKYGDLSDLFLRYLEDMRLAGVSDGLAMTVFGPNLRNAHVTLGFDSPDFDPSPQKVLEFQWVAQAGHLHFCMLSDRAALERKDLSAREREVLELIANGKSNSVISTLMDISPHTVDAHLRSIYAKFGVHDRTSAALIGIRQGILNYPIRR